MLLTTAAYSRSIAEIVDCLVEGTGVAVWIAGVGRGGRGSLRLPQGMSRGLWVRTLTC